MEKIGEREEEKRRKTTSFSWVGPKKRRECVITEHRPGRRKLYPGSLRQTTLSERYVKA
jgi:hypothetical protein